MENLLWRDGLFDGMIVAGQTFEKTDGYVSRMIEVYKFMSSEDAGNASINAPVCVREIVLKALLV